ncbi:hypothetical protein [Kitasatospora acidiphila]|uniref:hypothetical protein n=1 Tax=Kitasatospora acidiphila TaxID=2567942 RepID=UPI0015F01B5C|nr:hypothetical protein [Kitasatospora acidiphila]
MPATPVVLAPTVPLAVADGTVGDFETRIAVDCAANDLSRLAGWARDRSLKFTHIVLARGRMVSQPMVTLRGSAALARHRAQVAAAVHVSWNARPDDGRGRDVGLPRRRIRSVGPRRNAW